MLERRTKIVHISDLHLCREGLHKNYEILETDIQQQKPDIIIVTGDIVDNPFEDGLKHGKDKLHQLCRKCGFVQDKLNDQPFCKNLFTVPGNHDVKWLGNIKLPNLWKGSFKRLKNSKLKNLVRKDKINKKPYYDVFGQLRSEFIAECGVSIFSFDSNAKDYELTFARGRIGKKSLREKDQYAMIQQKCNDFSNIKGFEKSLKIAILHHHPIAIADLEYLKRFYDTDRDVFLELEDSGTFLREMTKRRINLVLHGHKHYPQVARYSADPLDHEIAIIAAGSSCKDSKKGSPSRSYNIIEILNDGKIHLYRRVLTTGSFVNNPSDPYELRSYEQYRTHLYHSEKKILGEVLKQINIDMAIDKYGDTSLSKHENGLKILDKMAKRKYYDYDIVTDIGCIRKLEIKRENIILPQDNEIEKDRHIKGKAYLHIEIDHNSDEIGIFVNCRVLNGSALTKEARMKMSNDPKPSDWDFHCHTVRKPAESLFMHVRFPENCEPINWHLEAYENDGIRSNTEENWLKNKIYYSQISNTIFCNIPFPIVGYRYVIAWQLPTGEDEITKMSGITQTTYIMVIDELLKLRDLDEEDEIFLYFTTLLRVIKKTIIERFSKSDNEESLDVNLMIFDNAQLSNRRLWRLVGTSFGKQQELWDEGLSYGDGVAGRAAKIKKSINHVRKLAKKKPETDYYVDLPGLTKQLEIILSIPLWFPFDHHNGSVFAVFNVTSSYLNSNLIGLYERSTSNRKKIDEIKELGYGVCKAILKKLGIKRFNCKDFPQI